MDKEQLKRQDDDLYMDWLINGNYKSLKQSRKIRSSIK